MKKTLTVFLLLVVSSTAIANGIDFFHGSWDELLKKARQEGKLVFVDVYTDWCGPCKIMASTTFKQPDVGAYFNKNFINYKLDAEDEEQNGIELSEKYQVQAFPTLLFLDSSGGLKHRVEGFQDSMEFVKSAKIATGEIVFRSPAELEAAYNGGDRSPDLVKEYLLQAEFFDMETYQPKTKMIKVADEYFDTIGEKEWISRENFLIASKAYFSLSDPVVAHLLEHHDQYAKLVPMAELADYLISVNSGAIRDAAYKGDPVYKKYLGNIKGSLKAYYEKGFSSDMMMDQSEMGDSLEETYELHRLMSERVAALFKKNWGKYIELTKEQLSMLDTEKGRLELEKNSVEALLQEDCRDPKVLSVAKALYQKNYEQDPVFSGVTYATILTRLGEKAEAISIMDNALAAAEKMAMPQAVEYVKMEMDALRAELGVRQ